MLSTFSRSLLGPSIVFVAVALQACGGGGADNSAEPAAASTRSTMVRLQAEAVGSHCSNGGSQVLAGLDTNGNGVLDASEVLSTQYVCVNGSGGAVRSTLVALTTSKKRSLRTSFL